MWKAFLLTTLSCVVFTNDIQAGTLLLNGDFEDTTVTILPNGNVQYTGWTERVTNGGNSGIEIEGLNGLSIDDITANRFDGATSAAPDPYFPYISAETPQLDHFAFARPSVPAPVDSFAELFSTEFVIDGAVSIDVWRESVNADSSVSFWRASNNELLASFTVTTAAKEWTRVTFDTSGLIGERGYIVLHGGTNQAGLGWLTLFDNATGGVSVVPEPSSVSLLVVGIGSMLSYRSRKNTIHPIRN